MDCPPPGQKKLAISAGLTVFVCVRNVSPWTSQARFKHRVTAIPNSIDRTRFNFSMAVARQALPCYTAVARLGLKCRAAAVLNLIHTL